MKRCFCLVLVALACGPTAPEQQCLTQCDDWNAACGFEQEEGTTFCDGTCLVDEGGDLRDCEPCLACVHQQGESFCPPAGDTPGFTFAAYDEQGACAVSCEGCL